jgi:cytochrome c553
VPRWLAPALALLVLLPGPLRAADAPIGGPPGASSCSGCHAAAALTAAPTSVSPLAGRKAAAFVAAMRAFKESGSAGTVMPRIARGFSESEIEAMASWFEAER